ncbi:MAG TPA: hypothetical protein VIM41_08805 [Gammaproteobacteria bacterium]
MWTGKPASQWLMVVGSFTLFACVAQTVSTAEQSKPNVAWWYDIEFQPTANVVHGLNVRTIDEHWQRAYALDVIDLQGRIPQDEIKRFNASPLKFAVTSDLDGDGAPENFFVGVYEGADGRKGRFVAITRNGRPLQRFEEEGSIGFSALLKGEAEVRWYKCMECGEFESIKWTGQAFVLE